MSSSALWQLSATELAGLVATRKVSPVEVTASVLERIAEVGGPLNAFVVLDAEGARDQAKAAEAAVMRGDTLGPIHGVPVTIKDMQAVKGLPTRRGHKLSDPAPAAEDCVAAGRLRAAGGIILGKSTTTEMGWTAVSHNPLTGATHNPWKHGMTSGGSSSGAASLAGAGCGPLHLGSDGAGSVRLPSHFCGTIGHKPTFGTVPYNPTPNNGHLSHIGPITRSVADNELMLEVMAGLDPRDATSHAIGFKRGTRRDVKGLRIAYSPDLGHAKVDREVADLVEAAARVFEDLGANVEKVTPPWGPKGPALIRELWGPALISYVPKDARAAESMDPGFVACLDDAAKLEWKDVSAAYGRRLAYAAEFGTWFESGYDLLLTPSASVAAFPVGRQRPEHWPQHDWDWLVWAEFSYPYNLAHGPAVSVPCGLTAAGLPVGLQIGGPRYADPLVMNAAGAFLAAKPFRYPWEMA